MLSKQIIARLEAKQEELALLFLAQSDTKEWQDLSNAQRRGDAYWNKKNAAQTLGLMVRIQSLLSMRLQKADNQDADVERKEKSLAKKAEAEAISMIERVRMQIVK